MSQCRSGRVGCSGRSIEVIVAASKVELSCRRRWSLAGSSRDESSMRLWETRPGELDRTHEGWLRVPALLTLALLVLTYEVVPERLFTVDHIIQHCC